MGGKRNKGLLPTPLPKRIAVQERAQTHPSPDGWYLLTLKYSATSHNTCRIYNVNAARLDVIRNTTSKDKKYRDTRHGTSYKHYIFQKSNGINGQVIFNV